jgi:hypothetical protein
LWSESLLSEQQHFACGDGCIRTEDLRFSDVRGLINQPAVSAA